MKRQWLIAGLCLVGIVFGTNSVKAEAGVPQNTSETTYVEVVDNRNYADLVIAQVDNYVNVRKGPGTDTQILGKLYNNSVGHYIEEENGWVKITSGSVTGYVSS